MTEKMNRSEIMIFDRSNSTHSLQKRASGVRLAAQPDLWAKQMLLMQYLSEADTLAADALLQTIPINSLNSSQQAEWNNLVEYYSLCKQIAANENNLPDSLQVITLMELSTHISAAGSYARNLLISQNILVYSEPYIFPNENLKSGKIIRRKHVTNGNIADFKVYPNPAKDYVIIEYTGESSNKISSIEIMDAMGRIILKRKFEEAPFFQKIPLTGLAPGSYTIRFISFSGMNSESKLIILH